MPDKSLEKDLLAKIFIEQMSEHKVLFNNLIENISPFPRENKQCVKSLINKGKIIKLNEHVNLTEKGRKSIKVVLCGGTFDILHPGHLLTLKKAKSLGDILVVIVATDETAEKTRGRKPYNSEQKRLELVNSLKVVDFAMIGERGSIYGTLLRVKPDIVVLGYDQTHKEKEIESFANSNNLRVKVIRLTEMVEGVKSSTLLKDTDLVNET